MIQIIIASRENILKKFIEALPGSMIHTLNFYYVQYDNHVIRHNKNDKNTPILHHVEQ